MKGKLNLKTKMMILMGDLEDNFLTDFKLETLDDSFEIVQCPLIDDAYDVVGTLASNKLAFMLPKKCVTIID